MASKYPPKYPEIDLETGRTSLRNEDVQAVEQRTGVAFGNEYRYYVARMKDGKEWRLRSVTECLKVLNKEALIQWAVDECCADIRGQINWDDYGQFTFTPGWLDNVLAVARKAHYRKKEEAAYLGTRAHEIIEAFLRTGKLLSLAEEDDRVANCVELFLDWWSQQKLSVVNTELMVYDVTKGYAGQLDFLALNEKGEIDLIDWKTSKDLYWDYELQVLGYAAALAKMGRGKPARIRIVRIGKEDAAFEVREIPREIWRARTYQFYLCTGLAGPMKEAENERRRRLDAEKKAAEAAETEAQRAQQQAQQPRAQAVA